MRTVNIIIPCWNEAENIDRLISEIDLHTRGTGYRYELTFVDDGSSDGTYRRILEAVQGRDDVGVIKLSRNFGKESAIKAGIELCDADAAIVIDSDLQHPPHLIPALLAEWEQGANIVDAVKVRRQRESFVVRRLSLAFNALMSRLTTMDFTGASDYKLVDRKAIGMLRRLDEKNRFFRGLTNWIGLRHGKVEFEAEERRSGRSKWGLVGLARLFFDAVTAFTSKPLHIVTYLGLFTLVFSFVLGLQTLYNKLYGHAVSGFTTVIIIVLILSSTIMISIGILGMYLSRIYDEVKNRPIFMVDRHIRCRGRDADPGDGIREQDGA